MPVRRGSTLQSRGAAAAADRSRLPGAAVQVVHDTELILATAELTTGIALIAGTGSVAWGRDASGAVARAGGWGYLLGDEGSGYGIAREVVRHALRLADEGQPPDQLSEQLITACNLQRRASSSTTSTRIQSGATGQDMPGGIRAGGLGDQPPNGSSTTLPPTWQPRPNGECGARPADAAAACGAWRRTAGPSAAAARRRTSGPRWRRVD